MKQFSSQNSYYFPRACAGGVGDLGPDEGTAQERAVGVLLSGEVAIFFLFIFFFF